MFGMLNHDVGSVVPSVVAVWIEPNPVPHLHAGVQADRAGYGNIVASGPQRRSPQSGLGSVAGRYGRFYAVPANFRDITSYFLPYNPCGIVVLLKTYVLYLRVLFLLCVLQILVYP